MYYTSDLDDARRLLKEAFDDHDRHRDEMDKKAAAIDGIRSFLIERCDFDVGDKVYVMRRPDKHMGEYDHLFIYGFRVPKDGRIYAKLCEPLKSDGSMPKDPYRKRTGTHVHIQYLERIDEE